MAYAILPLVKRVSRGRYAKKYTLLGQNSRHGQAAQRTFTLELLPLGPSERSRWRGGRGALWDLNGSRPPSRAVGEQQRTRKASWAMIDRSGVAARRRVDGGGRACW